MKRSVKRNGTKAAIFALFLSIFVVAQQTISAKGNDGRIIFSSVYSNFTNLLTGENASGATGLKKYTLGSPQTVSGENNKVEMLSPSALSGIKTIPGDYATLNDAITDLNAQGVGAGGVTFNVTAAQTAPSGGYIIGGTGSAVLTTSSAANPIVFVGNNNTATAFGGQTVGNVNDAVFKLIGADYVTIQGFTIQENAANTTIATAATNNATEFGIALFYVTLTDGAQNNTIQNNAITLNRAYLNSIGIYSNTRTNSTALTTLAEVTAATGSNSNNRVYGNVMSNMNYGIVFIGAGTTLAAIDSGNDIGGTLAGTGNTITNWGGGSSLTAYTSLTTSNYCVFMNQQINDNFSFNTITSAALAQGVTTGGFLKNYSVAQPTTGTITTTINNNTVTVNNNPTVTTAGSVIGINNQGLSTLLSTATMSMNNNTVQNSVLGGATSTTNGLTGITNLSAPGTMNMTGNSVLNNSITATTATTGGVTAISSSGAAGTLNITGNTIVNNSINTASSTSGILLGISNSGAAGTANINNNILRSFASTAASGQMQGIVSTGAVTTALNINNNQFGNATSGYFSSSVASSGTLFGVSVTTISAAATLSITGNDIRGITYNTAASAAQTYFTWTHAGSVTDNINSNTFTNLNINTTGAVTFLARAGNLTATGIENCNNNSIVTGFNKGGSGGTVTVFSANASSVTGSAMNQTGNNFSNITVPGSTVIAGWSNTEGASSTSGPIKTITNNTFNNWTANTTPTGTITGLTVNFGGLNNVISGNSMSGYTGGSTITGLALGGSNQATSAFQNTISTYASSGSAVVSGITSAVPTTANIFRNKLYDLGGTNAGTTVNGILITGGTTANVYNNLIGNLTASAASGTDVIRGISSTSTTTTSNLNVSFNTVYINATSSGANFGTSALYHTANATSTTATLNLRNNILTNLSTAAGTGLTVAYRRSVGTAGTLANYGSVSNNNDFYAGTPSATNLLYSDGTSSAQTLTAYKSGAFTAGTIAPRDSNSISENPPFLTTTGSNANFLHINTATPTQLESGGITVAGITDDFDGQTRNVSTPDVGADEFNGILIDINGPSITFTDLLNTSSTTNRTLTITVVDPSGVPTAGIGLPVIYYRKGTSGAYASTQCTFVSGNNYSCVINYALVTGGSVTVGDTIQYYVAAQDNAGNVSVNPSTGASGLTANPPAASTPPTAPKQYTIVNTVNGTISVGTAETYTSLTNAGGIFEFINNNEVTGNITINITSDLTNEGGTIPLNVFAGGFTITIKPSGGPRAVTGTATATQLIKINGASGVIIDGSTSGGTDRSLTLSHTNIVANSVVWFASVGTTPIANDVLKNSIVRNGAITGSTAVVIGDSGTFGNPGYFSTITVQNNDIQRAIFGVYANGGTTPQNGAGLTVSQNTMTATGTSSVRNVGIYMQGVNGATVSDNTVGNFDAADGENDTGIWLASGTINAAVSGNTVSTLGYTGTSTFLAYGIRDSGGATASGNSITANTVSAITSNGAVTSGPTVVGIENSSGGTIIQRNNVQGVNATNTGTYGAAGINLSTGNNVVVRNNFISNVMGDMTGGAAFSTTFGIFGIRVATGTGHQIYFNSVNLYGLRSGTATTSLLTASFAAVSTASTGMDVRNNIFANNITGGTTSIANVSMYLPSGGTSAMNLTTNNNAYYYGTDTARQGAGQAGTTAGTNFYTNLAALKVYTATLSTAGTNDNASLEATTAPPFVSNNNLHITGAGSTVLLGAGAPIASVTNDYDNETRDAVPDIGADEIVSAPVIMVSTPSLADFGSVTVGNNSASQSYTVSGSSLTANITVTAPSTDFQVSLDNMTFTNSVTVTQTGGTASATIYVRFTPQSPGAKSGNVTNASTGATTQNVAVSGTGVAANTPPTISAVGVTRQAGSPGSNSTIANVNDAESGANAVVVTVVGSSTVNGVTISGIVNSGGTVTANVVAVCGATNASFTLQASDGTSTATATLNVTVTANTAPTLTYNNASVAFGGSTTVNPATGPSDNGSVSSIVVQSQGTYTGTISVNNTTGVVSISNAAPAGTHTITIRATDQCGSNTDATFTLTVNAPPTVSLSIAPSTGSEAAATTFTATVTASFAVTGSQSVNFALTGGSASSADFGAIPTSITIASGQTTGTATFSVFDDALAEGPEMATFSISSPSSGITLGSPTMASVTIIDNDDNSAPSISYTPLPAKPSASSSTLTATVTDNVAVQSVSITYAIGNGAPTTVGCAPGAGSTYSCVINETGAAGQSISYYVSATDTSGNTSNNPATLNNGYAIGSASIQGGNYDVLNVLSGSLAGNVVINTNFSYTGIITSSSATLRIGCNATLDTGNTSKFINATIIKDFCSTQTFIYPLGNTPVAPLSEEGSELGVVSYYTPVTVNVTSVVNPSSLTASVTDQKMVGTDAANSISRYWTLTETGSITANLTFQYDASDVTGNESAFKVIKNEGGNTTLYPGSTINTVNHTASVTGISDFSLWSAGALTPTAANASISGRVLTADGQGIRNAVMTISGGNLTEPRLILTGSFGYYKFDDLEAGQTYIINIKSKRYVFTNPTTVITVQDDVTDYNFQAAP